MQCCSSPTARDITTTTNVQVPGKGRPHEPASGTLQDLKGTVAGPHVQAVDQATASQASRLGHSMKCVLINGEPGTHCDPVAQVAAVSGDARRVLEMCRRAAGFAEGQARAAGKLPEANAAPAEQAAEALKGIVKMGHVDRVVQETANQAHMRLISSAPRLEKALLACLLMETRATGLLLSCPALAQLCPHALPPPSPPPPPLSPSLLKVRQRHLEVQCEIT